MKTLLVSASLIVGLALLATTVLAQPATSQTSPNSASDLNDSLSVEASWTLMEQGSKLTAQQVTALEAKLLQNPKDLTARLQLLGHEKHGEAMPPAGAKLLLGLLQNNPRSPISGPICIIISVFEQQTFTTAISLWKQHVKSNPDDPRILGNAAEWMEQLAGTQPEYHAQSKSLFERARALDPQNPEWAEHLGQAWLYDASVQPASRRAVSAKKGMELIEAAYLLRNKPSLASFRLPSGESYLELLAKASLLAGETNKAKEYAIKLLKTVNDKMDGWRNGNLIYQYNSFLGLIALHEKNFDEAVKYLLAAGQTPGSPQLNSFGPDFELAREVLKMGRQEDRAAVGQFLDAVANFWAAPDKESSPVYRQDKVRNQKQIAAWKVEIAAGEIPKDRQWHTASQP